MPSARLKSSKGRAQGGLCSSSGACRPSGGAPWCSSARAPLTCSALARGWPPGSLHQPVTQHSSVPASSACTLSSSHCRRCTSPRARGSACCVSSACSAARSLPVSSASTCRRCGTCTAGSSAGSRSQAGSSWLLPLSVLTRCARACRAAGAPATSRCGAWSMSSTLASVCSSPAMAASAAAASAPGGSTNRRACTSGPADASSCAGSGLPARASSTRAHSCSSVASASARCSARICGSASCAQACTVRRACCSACAGASGKGEGRQAEAGGQYAA